MNKLLLITLALFSLVAQANEENLLALVKEKQRDSASLEKALAAGSARAMLCKFCHGQDGNSVKSTIPNLAAQNTTYLIRQFELFANKKRQNKTMNELARLLSDEDKVNIALFFNAQKIKPQTIYRPELVAAGKKLFELKCFFCHGKQGYGKETFPHIASQPGEYIVKTLNSYSASLVKRAETDMSRVARALTKEEIEKLAAYLTSLR